MFFRFISTLLIILSISINVFSQDSVKVTVNEGELTLNITGFSNDEGTVKIALSNTKEDYATKGKAYRGVKENILNNKAQTIFKDLPFGIYAIKIFHDENDNGELDKNFFGIPSEDYGFSNNAKGSFGPASWEDAQFKFEKDQIIVEINIE